MKRINELLKDKRVESGYTQLQLANKLGYSNPQFISNWERGICLPPIKQARVLCKLLDISVDAYKQRIIIDFRKKLDRELGD